MAATIDPVLRGEIDRSSTVPCAHLGGQPALDGYSALLPTRPRLHQPGWALTVHVQEAAEVDGRRHPGAEVVDDLSGAGMGHQRDRPVSGGDEPADLVDAVGRPHVSSPGTA
jgi:hypothetical protein